MKLVFYSSNSIYSGKPVGGAEHSLSLLAKGLAAKGEEVHFLTHEVGKRFSRSRTENINGVIVHFLPNFSIPLQRLKFLKRLNEWIFQHVLFSYLNKHFKSFDIVHGYNEYPDVYYLLKWKFKYYLKIKIIIRVAGLFWHEGLGLKSDGLKRKVEYVYNNVDSANFISQGLEKQFHEILMKYDYRIKLKHSFIIDIGVPIPPQLYERNLKLRPFKLVMTARFTQRQKRQDLLINAFCKANIYDSELILFGEGETKKRLQEFCQVNDFLKTRVKFMGYKSKDFMRQELANSSLFCMCTDYEGLCKSVLEAMSFGVPVLVSNVSALNGYVREGVNGFVVDNEVDKWSDKLIEIYKSPIEELSEIGNRAYMFVKDSYDEEKNINGYLNQFSQINEQ